MIKKRELRKKQIEKKISDILESVRIIEENLPEEFEDFSNSGLIKDGIYKKIEFVIESVIDICNIINSDLRLGMPEDEDAILKNLKNIFKPSTIELIEEMKRFRNILVHRYGQIEDLRAFETIKDGLQDFETIIKNFEEFLEENWELLRNPRYNILIGVQKLK